MRVRASQFVKAGQLLVMADLEHPEASTAYVLDGEVPDGRIVYCHPEDEQRILDAIAVEQERPKWWRDWQRVEAAIRAAVEGGGGA